MLFYPYGHNAHYRNIRFRVHRRTDNILYSASALLDIHYLYSLARAFAESFKTRRGKHEIHEYLAQDLQKRSEFFKADERIGTSSRQRVGHLQKMQMVRSCPASSQPTREASGQMPEMRKDI